MKTPITGSDTIQAAAGQSIILYLTFLMHFMVIIKPTNSRIPIDNIHNDMHVWLINITVH